MEDNNFDTNSNMNDNSNVNDISANNILNIDKSKESNIFRNGETLQNI